MSVHGELGAVEGAEDDLADLPGHGIKDEEEEDSDQCQQQQQHQDAPVPAPDEDEGLQRVHKPVEGGFGAAVGEQVVSDEEETLACLHHRHPRPLPRIWPRLLRPPLTWASPRAQAPCAPSPLAVSQPPPQSAAQILPQPFPGKEGTEAKFLGGLRPTLDPRPPTLPPLPPPFLPTVRR